MTNDKLNKLFSGRFLFTIAVIVVFTVLSLTNRLPIDKITEVILLVLYAYFNRSDRASNGVQNKEEK